MPQIQVGQEVWQYTISRRAKKYMHISLNRNGEICVSAPKRVPNYQIEKFIYDQVSWIRKQKEKQKGKQNVLKDGGMVWYHGVCYPVVIEKSNQNSFAIVDDHAIIKTKELEDVYIENIFQKWILLEAKPLYEKTVEIFLEPLQEYGVEKPRIQIRQMKSKWGSCIPSKKKITLNIALMYVPVPCMEYVVLHELVHFLEANHGKNFYALIAEQMPDWKERKKRLNQEFGNIL